MTRRHWSHVETLARQPQPPQRTALMFTLAYAGLAAIGLSAGGPSARGLAFVALTATPLYLGLRHALQRLHSAEFRWRHVLNSLQDVTWIASAQGDRFLYINDAARQVYGRDPMLFVDRPEQWWDALHADDRERVRAAVSALRDVGSGSLTYRIVRSDGAVRWLKDRASVIRDTDGRVLALAGVATDVTERQRQRTVERDVQQRLQGIVESAMDAMLTVDARQRIVLFNRAAAVMFGVPPVMAIGRPLADFLPLPQRLPPDAMAPDAPPSGPPSHDRERLRALQARRADGQVFPVEATISRSGEGADQLTTAIVRDLSEEIQAREARRAAVVAEAASRAKSELLARVSHELRTPLHAVLGFSQLLAADAELQPAQRERAECIRTAGWYLAALIDDVLDLSQAQARTLTLRLADLGVRAAATSALELCDALAVRHQVTLAVDPALDATLAVRADTVRLRQVLVNLVSNAVKYNRPQGTVTVTARPRGPSVCICVHDTGLGMSAEQQRHLFEPFNRLGREGSNVEGHGIGLVLVRELLQLMGGTLDIESEVGRGTTIRVDLPRAPDLVPQPSAAAVRGAAAAAPTSVTGRVLCIEDDPVNALLVREALSSLPGVQVQEAATGLAALHRAETEPPDLVLADMNLPDLGGAELMQRLRALPGLERAVLVALTADASPQSREAALAAGARHYWLKPFDFAQLRTNVAAVLAERHSG